MSADGKMHRHYKLALIGGALALLAVGVVALAAFAPVAAIALGVGGGTVGLYAGGHWVMRKLGIKPGRRWRAPRSRTTSGRSSRSPGRSRGLRFPSLRGRKGSGKLLRGRGKGGSGSGRSRGRLLGASGKRGGLFKRGRGAGLLGAGKSGRKGLLGRKRAGAQGGTGISRKGLFGRRRGSAPGGMGASRKGRRGLFRRHTTAPGGIPGGKPRRRLFGKRSAKPGSAGTGARRGLFGRRGGKPGTSGAGSRRSGLRRLLGRKAGGGKTPRTPKSPRQGSILRRGGRALRRLAPSQRRKQAGKPAQSKPWVKGAEIAATPFIAAFLSGRWLWRKARKRKAEPVKAEPEKPAARGPDPEPPVPEPQPKMARPVPATVFRPPMMKENHPVMNHIDAASEAASQHIGQFEPDSAEDLGLFLSGLPSYFESVSTAFRTVAERLADGYPVHPSIPERLREIGATVGGMSDFAAEAHSAHRAMHEKELDRIENPRRGEEFWDVKNQ
ncbi:MAG: hypothetical protein J2P30_00025 [Actinobacteria bacterium]|nr:hypothetical protein [Actinomycetota bacterium]